MKFDIVTRTLPKIVGNRASFSLQQHSPEILLGAGIVGMIGSTVMACRATLKVEEILKEHKGKVEIINQVAVENEDEYTAKDRQRDLAIVYTQTGSNLLKLYGPPIALGVASISCVVSGHNVLRQRNIALVAPYKTLDSAFRRYRERVVEELGPERDYMFRHGLRAEEIVEQEEGKKASKKKAYVVKDPNKIGPYSRIFDESNPEWQSTTEYNKMWLQIQQNYCNQYLQANGHLFLNQVYELLGFDHTQAGAIVGWTTYGDGDGFVDFGIFTGPYDMAKTAFINGSEQSILLDFNVDGPIYNILR